MLVYLEPVCEFFGINHGQTDYKVTTLGICATIMILYNIIAWPYIHECTNMKKNIKLMHTQAERAWAVVEQVDVLVEFCTSIMSTIKNLASEA